MQGAPALGLGGTSNRLTSVPAARSKGSAACGQLCAEVWVDADDITTYVLAQGRQRVKRRAFYVCYIVVSRGLGPIRSRFVK